MLVTIQSAFRFLPFSLIDELISVRDEWFPALEGRVDVGFDSHRALASIHVMEQGPLLAQIRLSYALDRPEVPLPVIRAILKHEMIHCEIRPEHNCGGWVSHPPAFWRREWEVAPEMRRVWQWVRANLGYCLRSCPETEGVEVVRSRPGRRRRVAAARAIRRPLKEGWVRLF